MTTLPLNQRVIRVAATAAGLALAVGTFAFPATAAAQGDYRDRGERYSRAQSESGGDFRNRSRESSGDVQRTSQRSAPRSAPRSASNNAQPSASSYGGGGDFTRSAGDSDGRVRERTYNDRPPSSGDFYRAPNRSSYNSHYGHSSGGYHHANDGYHDGYKNYGYKNHGYKPRSTVSFGFSAHSGYPAYPAPRYYDYGLHRTSYAVTHSYGHRPAYGGYYRPYDYGYCPPPVYYRPAYKPHYYGGPYYGSRTSVSFAYYGGYGHGYNHYPRYGGSSFNVGVRYDYRR